MSGLTQRHGYPHMALAHVPTPLERLDGLTAALGGPEIWVKRDDCTGLAMGGNKARQLEYYFGAAVETKADTVLITSAVQSNFMRMTAAAAAKLGMKCILQSESRVAGAKGSYRRSGNVLLDHLLGADIEAFEGEGLDDESLADAALDTRAQSLRKQGRNPYVIHLSAAYPPLGALGYVDAAEELVAQTKALGLEFDAVVLASGSALTHVGMLSGLRQSGDSTPVIGMCVRRPADAQSERVWKRAQDLANMLGRQGLTTEDEIDCRDRSFGGGYGKMADDTWEAITLAARTEGLLMDPVYTGKSLAGLVHLVRSGELREGQRVVFIHTGGTPALFGYEEGLYERLGQDG